MQRDGWVAVGLQGVVGQERREPRIVVPPVRCVSQQSSRPFFGATFGLSFFAPTTTYGTQQFQWNLGNSPQSISNARPGLCTTLFEILYILKWAVSSMQQPSFLFAHQPQVRRHPRGTLWVSDRGEPHSTDTSSTAEWKRSQRRGPVPGSCCDLRAGCLALLACAMAA